MSAAAPARWVLASGNPGKLREMRELLAPLAVTLVSQDDLGVVQPPELGQTFVENALTKARVAAAQASLPAIADDSGLTVAALQDRPGVRSARFAGDAATDEDNVRRLLADLADVPAKARGARFHCVIVALSHAKDPAPIIVQGVWRGQIATAPRGKHGFGYDPVFVGDGLEVTAAELSPAAKNELSHRGQALRALVETLGATGSS